MNPFKTQIRARRGVTLPMVAVVMVVLCSAIGLAVDAGRLALARNQVQTVADVAATAAARALNGIQPQDLTAPSTAAAAAAANNKVLGAAVAPSSLVVTLGAYRYSTSALSFSPAYTLNAGELYNLAKVDVSVPVPMTFAKVFGVSSATARGTSVAAHRPRDVVVVLDYSGSMNNESDLWNNESYLDNGTSAPNNANNTSNNCETVYPLFGHYANEKNYSDYAHYANLLCPTADASNPLTGTSAIGKSNVSIPALGVPAMVNDYWQNARGAATTAAFTQVADTSLDAYKQAGGDKFLRKSSNNAAQPYATNLYDVIGSTAKNATFEANGHKTYTGVTFSGYTRGPRYWGKTFFMWPPDPTNDWRSNYFGTTDNTKLWDASGNWRDPSGNYTINYKAILAWIKTAPNPFPSVLRSGNILYYSSIPTDVPASAYTHTNPNSAIADPSQRFWKEYIDYALGVWRDPNGNIQRPQSPTCSYGPDYTFGTIKVSVKPSDGRYMDYQDNPERPRHRLWFGPMTMVQYLSDTGLLPGTAHDISMYPMKLGIGGALQDIQNNHPNTQVAVVLFHRPQYNNDADGTGGFNNAQYSLSTDYQAMINSLWLPPNSGTTDVRPWDANGEQTPSAHGDYDSNTASSYGFMLAYNQLSSSPALRSLENGGTDGVGGLGRVGAQRVVIYETDGMANVHSSPANVFVNAGANNSYYPIQPGQTLNSAGYNQTALLQICQNICNDGSGSPLSLAGYTPFTPNLGYPGYSSPNRPVTIHTIAFGAIFEVPSSTQASAVGLLNSIAAVGGTRFPSSSLDSTDGYRWCVGTITQRTTKLRQAFTTIMNSGIPISLVQ